MIGGLVRTQKFEMLELDEDPGAKLRCRLIEFAVP